MCTAASFDDGLRAEPGRAVARRGPSFQDREEEKKEEEEEKEEDEEEEHGYNKRAVTITALLCG